MYIAFNIVLYFYIGYTYVCWIKYREGAGFDIHKFATSMAEEAWPIVTLLWPLTIMAHFCCNIYNRFDLERIVNKISPDSFEQRGIHDNDVDKQAEKHLLGGR